MGATASQFNSLAIVYSDTDQRKHQSSASLAFGRGIHRGPSSIWWRHHELTEFEYGGAAYMASRGLRMRGFYYGWITNKTTIKTIQYSVKPIYNVDEWLSPLLTM